MGDDVDVLEKNAFSCVLQNLEHLWFLVLFLGLQDIDFPLKWIKFEMNSEVNSLNTTEEEIKDDHTEYDDVICESDSQNAPSVFPDSEVSEECKESQTADFLIVNRDQKNVYSEQEQNTNACNQENERTEDDEEREENKKESLPAGASPTSNKTQGINEFPRSIFYGERQKQQGHPQKAMSFQQQKLWKSPMCPSQRQIHQQNKKESKDEYAGNSISHTLHLSQVESLKEELNNVLQESCAKTEYIYELEQKLKAMETDNSQIRRRSMITGKKLESVSKNFQESTAQNENFTEEVTIAKAEIERLKQNLKSKTNAHSNLEKRLSSVTTEMEKAKTEVAKLIQDNKEQEIDFQKKIEEMTKEKKGILKQNEDFNKVIKKQMKLIGNLRRQTMHLEAATVLKLSEAEFMKVAEKSSCGTSKDKSS